MKTLPTLAVIGVGLIGGSFARALRQAGVVGTVLGAGRQAANLAQAQALGVIDAVVSVSQAAQQADVVLLATPVGQLPPLFTQLAAHITPTTIISDVGSTKSDVVAAARVGLGEKFCQFVPAHPIAGAEKSGVGASHAELYRGKKVVLTPEADTDLAALNTIRLWWEACGAHVRHMSAAAHDRVFAAVSHLPHLLSFALVADLAARDDAALFFDYAASGFRDFTRIAGSHPEMWRDICLANQTAVLAELTAYQAQLSALQMALAAGDGAALTAIFELASHARNQWASGQASVVVDRGV